MKIRRLVVYLPDLVYTLKANVSDSNVKILCVVFFIEYRHISFFSPSARSFWWDIDKPSPGWMTGTAHVFSEHYFRFFH
jgi:hypothetical protein